MGNRVFYRDERTRVFVRGNAIHPEKVWGVLEERGGKRFFNYDYTNENNVFYIGNDGYIDCISSVSLYFEWLKSAWGEILLDDKEV